MVHLQHTTYVLRIDAHANGMQHIKTSITNDCLLTEVGLGPSERCDCQVGPQVFASLRTPKGDTRSGAGDG